MNWLDWALLVVWALAAIYGLKQRATRMVAGLVILVVGFLVARPLAQSVQGRLGFISENEFAQLAAAYIIVIILAVVAAATLGWMMGKMLGLFPLGALADRGLGLAIGLLVGLLITGAILSAVVGISDAAGEFVDATTLGGFLVGPFNAVVAKLGLALPF